MSEELIGAEMHLFQAMEGVVSTGRALGYARERVWADLASAASYSPETQAIRRTQFDLIWPEGTS